MNKVIYNLSDIEITKAPTGFAEKREDFGKYWSLIGPSKRELEKMFNY